MRMTLNWKTFGILGYMYGCIYSEDAFIVELDCILLVKYIHNFTMAMFLAHNIRFTSYRFDVHFSFVNKLVWLQKCFILHLPRFFFYLSRSIHYTLWCWYRFLFTVLFKHEYIFKANNLQNALIALNSDLYMQFFLINTMIASIVIDDISTNSNEIMHRGN